MGGRSSREVIYQSDPALTKMIATQAAMLEDQRKDFERIIKTMEEREIESFEDLKKADSNMAKQLLKLAESTTALKMEGHNVGFFGNTSVGKSYLLNSLHGSKVAESGPGETTLVITKYPSINTNLWDVPGKNDALNYYNVEYISCIKGLTTRVVMVSSTVKEMSKVICLFQQLHLSFVLVVNKCDQHDDDDLSVLRKQIQNERDLICPGVPLFFVSAKKPTDPRTKEDFQKLVYAITPSVPGGAPVAAAGGAGAVGAVAPSQ